MAPGPPHTHSTPRKRKRDSLTSDSGNDSDSDYNPRKPNQKPKVKPKSSTPAPRDQSIAKILTSLPLQPPGPYLDATDGEERADVQLPTPPKISLFLKFGKKAKTGSKSTAPSSSQDRSSGYASVSPQVPLSPASTSTPTLSQSILKSTGRPIPITNLLATHQTRSATGSLPSVVVPHYKEPSIPSLDSFDFVADLLGAPSSPLNPFHAAKKMAESAPGRSTSIPSAPPIKPSGIKLRLNIKPKGKKFTFEDTPSVVPSPDTSSQEPKSSVHTTDFRPRQLLLHLEDKIPVLSTRIPKQFERHTIQLPRKLHEQTVQLPAIPLQLRQFSLSYLQRINPRGSPPRGFAGRDGLKL